MSNITTDTQGTITEVRIDGEYAGIVVKYSNGWQARHLGINSMHPTEDAAIADLHSRLEESKPSTRPLPTMVLDLQLAAQAIVNHMKAECEEEGLPEATAQGIRWTGLTYLAEDKVWFEVVAPGSADGTLWQTEDGDTQDGSIYPL